MLPSISFFFQAQCMRHVDRLGSLVTYIMLSILNLVLKLMPPILVRKIETKLCSFFLISPTPFTAKWWHYFLRKPSSISPIHTNTLVQHQFNIITLKILIKYHFSTIFHLSLISTSQPRHFRNTTAPIHRTHINTTNRYKISTYYHYH